MLTAEEMRVLAGAEACDQSTCSNYTYTRAISACSTRYWRYYTADCLTNVGDDCQLAGVWWLHGIGYDNGYSTGEPSAFDYCETSGTHDHCGGGDKYGQTKGRNYCLGS